HTHTHTQLISSHSHLISSHTHTPHIITLPSHIITLPPLSPHIIPLPPPVRRHTWPGHSFHLVHSCNSSHHHLRASLSRLGIHCCGPGQVHCVCVYVYVCVCVCV